MSNYTLLQPPTITATPSSTSTLPSIPDLDISIRSYDNKITYTDSTFNGTVGGWTATNANLTTSSTFAATNEFSLLATPQSANPVLVTSAHYPVTPANFTTLTAWVLSTIASNSSVTITTTINWYDPLSNLLSSTSFTPPTTSPLYPSATLYPSSVLYPSGGSDTSLNFTSSIPSTAATFTLTYAFTPAATTDLFYLTRPGVFCGLEPYYWTPGPTPSTVTYTLYKSPDGITFTQIASGVNPPDSTAVYTDTALTPNTTYYYRVTTSSLNSMLSDPVTVSYTVGPTYLASPTVSTLLADIRFRLDSTNPAISLWSDTELINWINEALIDIARRTETLEEEYSVLMGANLTTFLLPPNCLRVHRLEYQPANSILTYPVEFKEYNVMDTYWGNYQTMPNMYPLYYTIWGQPPVLNIKVFPVPAGSGYYNVFYYALPTTVALPTDVLGVPLGWSDLVANYVEFTALRKARDPRWQEAAGIYQDKLEAMIEKTRQYTDGAGQVSRNPIGQWADSVGYTW